MKRSIIGLACMTMCSAGALMAASTPAYAQQAEARRDFNIPAQPLASALIEFSRQSGTVVTAPARLTRQKSASTLRGNYTPAEALRTLLIGSGLRFRVGAGGSFIIEQGGGQVASNTPSTASASSPAEDETNGAEIVVTGTNIRGATITSPLVTVSRREIERSGYQNTGDLIRSLPQSFAGGINANVIGAAGANNPGNPGFASSANLRGLGSDSTLTLVNGQRLPYTDEISANDISIVPLPAVQRVEILTDGASAIYGSDAVGGVVNFILRRDYEGVETSATIGGSTQGGGRLLQASALGGTRWNDGGLLLSYEYADQNGIQASQRDYTSASTPGTYLIPETRRHSLFGLAHQSLGGSSELFVQGLYTDRNAYTFTDLGIFLPGLAGTTLSNVHQFGIVGGIESDLGGTWRAKGSVNYARQITDRGQATTLNGLSLSEIQSDFRTQLVSADISANGSLGDWGTGSIKLALGASARWESYSGKVTVNGSPDSDVASDRNIQSGFAELEIPLVRSSSARAGMNRLVVTTAGRVDDYSDFGTSFVPKIGLLYAPDQQLTFKASWGRSFRAPSQAQENTAQSAILILAPDPQNGNSIGPVLLRAGGNRDLEPERARTWTINAAYEPQWLRGARLELTYYDIAYRGRIASPIANASLPLNDPFGAPFTIRNPTSAEVQSVVAASSFINNTGGAFDPASVVAIVDDRVANISRQRASGFDVLLAYQFTAGRSTFDATLNATWLDLDQQLLEGSSRQQLSGRLFNPARFRLRGGIAWERSGISISAFVNHVGPSLEDAVNPPEQIAPWTTADLRIAYSLPDSSALRGLGFSLAVQNLFDKDPPYITGALAGLPGLHYDSTNASSTGRFISFQITKRW